MFDEMNNVMTSDKYVRRLYYLPLLMQTSLLLDS